MPIILMKIENLASRGKEIRTMLQPISRQKGGPAWDTKRSSREFIIAIYDGTRLSSEYRDWRFSTFVPNFHAMYFELWKRTEEDERYWYLDRAYFSIYQRIDWKEKEFLCLHCDPNVSLERHPAEAKHEKAENRAGLKKKIKQISNQVGKLDESGKEKYKKGPHLHIKAADEPLPHAHFALNLGHLEAVLESVESLSEAMRYAIFMLKEEFLDVI